MVNNKKASSLADWDRQYLWHPFTQMQEWQGEVPVIIERGKGPYLIDTEGRRYLDGTSSIWVNLHGHRHPRLDRALDAQRKRIAHSTLLGLSNPPAIRLARELIAVAPKGLTRVFYSDDGSTAVEVACETSEIGCAAQGVRSLARGCSVKAASSSRHSRRNVEV